MRLSFLVLCASGAAAEEVEDLENSTAGPGAINYTAPDESLVTPLHFVDTFDDLDAWTKPTAEKFTGTFAAEARQKEALIGDRGLVIMDEARHHGLVRKFPSGPIRGPVVVQFEVQFQSDLKCGGAYLKLLDSSQLSSLADFGDATRYVIMFGPDRCGSTNKVHFILQHQSPKTGKWEEKHAKGPAPPFDKKSHVYTLVISGKSRFEIFIDLESKLAGDLLKDMDPPVNPPKQIPDPEDIKPSDWVEDEFIPDPLSEKPQDWDDDAPEMILDPKDVKPAAWEDDGAFEIPDPDAVRPEGWDDEEDGEWAPPMVKNPACKPPGGCGPWTQKKMKNPEYQGVWAPKKIKNPEYKGTWAARAIPNPDFFEDRTPADVPGFDSVGFELWTMQSGILFDNIVIAKNAGDAFAFATATWKARRAIEDTWSASSGRATGGYFKQIQGWLQDSGLDGWHVFIVLGLGIVFVVMNMSGGRKDAPAPKADMKDSPKVDEKKEAEGKEDKETSKAEDESKAAEAAEQTELRNRNKAAGLNLNED
jgi:calnexin